MPVLSPRHSSSLSGSYRSTFSSTLSRPSYYGSSYSGARITTSTTSSVASYSAKTYASDEGKKLYARRSSDAYNGASGGVEREASVGRDARHYSATLSMIDSVADLRNKYSPSNYVPAVLRKDIERSRSINDIGRPPLGGEAPAKAPKKVTNAAECCAATKTCVAFTNRTNQERVDNYDATNGNRTASVAEIRKKFDGAAGGPAAPCRKQHFGKSARPELLGGNIKCYKQQFGKINQDVKEEDGDLPGSGPHNHTTNFASYIPNNVEESADQVEISETQNRIVNAAANNDVTTSPRLPRSSISQSSSISTANSRSSPSSTRGSPPTATNRASASPTTNQTTTTTTATTTTTTTGASSAFDSIRARSLAANANANANTTNDEDRNGRYGSGRSHGLNGLKNIGNTCFMNSVIQCLSNTKYLLEYVREDGYQSDINTSISSMKGALIKAFSQVIQELWSPDSADKVVNTVALKSQIQRFAPRFMGYAQQDAQEFLRYLLEGLHEDVNRVTSKPKPILTEIDETLSDSQKASEAWSRYLRMDNSRVVDIFVGQLKSTLRCTHCGHCSVTFDPFWDLSLPIPQRQGPLRLGQCLEYFTREETMDGDEKPTCSKCKERRKCTKSFCIQKFPKILVIHLKRFSPTERFRGKLSLVIDFPLQGLDLSAFAASKSQTESMYNLYAISNHSGTTYSGHYTAYCKHPYSGQWHEYNDSRVSTISSKNVVSSEAYVLFYELINQNSHL